ncbi:hypothetical protein HK097_008819 [Rhizophlyctis rosea]|uniref:Uncharacterized protein n=1 Tax=Rhizophlyctis rosea TaxID=64517 RepID=A0AAD5SBE3_9FUNG|nr:hypothetical protein HK097_008819 [Rhizophlyctis rosea]
MLALSCIALGQAAPNPQGGVILTAGAQPNTKFSTCYVTETHKDGSKGQNLWMLQNGVDMKEWADPPGGGPSTFYPLWGSHADTACDCAAATGGENMTPYFVWDGTTKKCYPKYLPNPVRAWARTGARYYKIPGGGHVVPPVREFNVL